MALRTVGVKLQADVRDYSASITKAGKDTKGLADKLGEAAKSGDKTAAATADAARKVAGLADQMRASGRAGVSGFKLSEEAAAKLDRQILDTARSIEDLERQFAKTGDFKLLTSLNRQMSLFKRQLKTRDLFSPDTVATIGSDVGTDLATGASMSFAARLGPLIARLPMSGMHPAALAIAAPFAAAAASVVGASMVGAVVGGAGVGGVVGGLMLASKDARVKTAGAALGEELGGMLGRASSMFVPVTLDAIDLVQARMLGLEPQIRRIFAASARMVEPLIQGGLGAIERVLPGLVHAIERAQPVIEVISDGMIRIGDVSGNVLADLSDNADDGARALEVVFTVVEGGIVAFGKLVEAGAAVFDVLDTIGGPLWNLSKGSDSASESTYNLADRVRDLGQETQTLEEQVEALKTAFDELFGAQKGIDEATIRYKQGIRELNEELKDGKKTLSENSEEGLRNRQSVLDQIQAIADLRAARIEHGMTLDEADRKYVRDVDGLRQQMIQAGFTKTEVDRLTAAYRNIPKKVDTTVSANTVSAMQKARDLRNYLKNIPDEVVNIAVRITGASSSAARHALEKQYANRWGGIYMPAQEGLVNLRQADIYSAMSPARYAFAEPVTGGEAFVPRFGEARRSLGILDTAAGWYGADVVPQGMTQPPMVAMPASGGSQHLDVTIRWPDGTVAARIVRGGFTGPEGRDAVAGMLRGVRDAGGDVSSLNL